MRNELISYGLSERELELFMELANKLSVPPEREGELQKTLDSPFGFEGGIGDEEVLDLLVESLKSE